MKQHVKARHVTQDELVWSAASGCDKFTASELAAKFEIEHSVVQNSLYKLKRAGLVAGLKIIRAAGKRPEVLYQTAPEHANKDWSAVHELMLVLQRQDRKRSKQIQRGANFKSVRSSSGTVFADNTEKELYGILVEVLGDVPRRITNRRLLDLFGLALEAVKSDK